MFDRIPVSFKVAALGLASVLAYGSAALSAFYPDGFENAAAPPLATKTVKAPLTPAQFRQDIDTYSKDNMMVVLLRRNECARCEDVKSAMEESRYHLYKKVHAGFAIYELNAAQNPEAAALLQQRDPEAEAILHIFYNAEKIHESKGISADPRMMLDYLEMAHALAIGEVSILNKYEAPAVSTPPVITPPQP